MKPKKKKINQLNNALDGLSVQDLQRALGEMFLSNNQGPARFVSHEVACRLTQAMTVGRSGFTEQEFNKALEWASGIIFSGMLLEMVVAGRLSLDTSKRDPRFSCIPADQRPSREIPSPPPLPSYEGRIRFITAKGHDSVSWDRRHRAQISKARSKFDQLRRAGYAAYMMQKGQSVRMPMDEFDPDAEDIIMVAPVCAQPGKKT
jgi:hypothetical protein